MAGGLNSFIYPANPVGWVDPLGLEQVFEKSGLTFHANSGVGGREHARHGPGQEFHLHLGSKNGSRVNAYTFEPLTPEDAKMMTKAQREACKALTPAEKTFLKHAAREMFFGNKDRLEKYRAKLQAAKAGATPRAFLFSMLIGILADAKEAKEFDGMCNADPCGCALAFPELKLEIRC